ncbi:hypothetical protein G7Y89_g14187 [Cudoniella acicularis]|uniref:Uncharacterized protein n=1 Tax=Cudoniella acicularis TaxID=354080 RepID=A0A8H4R5J0_9HELO|nr:hypothetical protein G7Y89_g14187 [Cudoniella acicularis]
MIWIHVFAGTFGLITVDGMTANELRRRAELAASWQNWVFNGVFMFVTVGLAEETLKHLPITYARRRKGDTK